MTPIVPLALALVCLSDPTPLSVVEALEQAVADAIERVQPSVVAITRIPSESGETLAIRGRNPVPLPEPRNLVVGPNGAIVPEADRPGFPPPDRLKAPEYYALPGDFGSGVVVGDHNEILTTYHTLTGAERIRVRASGVEFDAEIIAADPRTDLAVIVPRSGDEPPQALPPLSISKAETLRQGAFLIALGNPYNAARDGKASASLGILSNVARRVEPLDDIREMNPNIKQFFRFQPTLMQLDSKLNLGMSGGGVVNLRGELVGLTTSSASPSGFDAAAGYAIPMDTLGRRVVERLKQGMEVEYGFIGIGLSQVPNTVSEVKRGTPADKANLAMGDKILAVDEIELQDNESSLPLALASMPVGEPVTLKVLHDGEVKERTLVMSKYPLMGEVIATVRPAPWRGAHIDFTSVLNDGLNTQETLQAMTRGGVGVIEVDPDSPAASAGLIKGLVITEVEGRPISTPTEFRAAVSKFDDQPVTLKTVNGLEDGKQLTIPAK